MKIVKHINIVSLKECFYSSGKNADEVYLNLILEYIPEPLSRFTHNFRKASQFVPLIYVKLFTFQLAKALNYIHRIEICHRDIKPQNVLIDPETGVLKLCDFGSAKQLVIGEPNVSYICSRYYRAPELIFGATYYTTSIDIWSLGCVFGEMLLGTPLFPGSSSSEQLLEIIKILGTPSDNEILAMNRDCQEFKFPLVASTPWAKVLECRKDDVLDDGCDLISMYLKYDPKKRISLLQSLAHPFFDDLRNPETRLPNNAKLPADLFVFTDLELAPIAKDKALMAKILNTNNK